MTDTFTPTKDLKVGDKIVLYLDSGKWTKYWGSNRIFDLTSVGQEVDSNGIIPGPFTITEILHRTPYFRALVRNNSSPIYTTTDFFCDDINYPVKLYTQVSSIKIQPLLTLDFNYSLNKHYWNDKLEQEFIQKSREKAESTIKRTLLAWPYGKTLVHEVDKTSDKIHFRWK